MTAGVVVLGCHRSGTSAAAATLAALGLSTGHGRMVTGVGNAEGHHEPYYLRALNDEVLRRLGGTWVGPPDLADGWQADPRLDRVRYRARVAFEATFDTTGWAWKDPRNCLTLPFWIEDVGLTPAVLLTLRDPLEVARSLAARGDVSEVAGLALWERSTRAALAAAAGRPTLVTTYERLLTEPVRWATDVLDLLAVAGIPLPNAMPEAAGAAVRPGLRRQTAGAPPSGAMEQAAGGATALADAVAAFVGLHEHFEPPDLPAEDPWVGLVLAEAGRAHDQQRLDRRALAEGRASVQPVVNTVRLKVLAHRLLRRPSPAPAPAAADAAPSLPTARLEDVERFVLFVGYPRSGHSLIGSLLDAHPDVVVAHELDALADVADGIGRDALYRRLLAHDQEFTEAGRTWMGYDYEVPGAWQGRTRRLRVIGDKKGGASTERLGQQPELLDRLRAIIGVPLVLVHVTRNPFDNIATIAQRSGAPLDACVVRYAELAATNERVRASLPLDPDVTWIDIAHEAVIDDPDRELGRLARCLGIEVVPQWLAASRAVVFPRPSRTRDRQVWPPAAVAAVQACIDRYPFLAAYRDDALPAGAAS